MDNITLINLKALAGRVLWCRVSWPCAKNVEPAGRMLTWFDLKIKKSRIQMDGWVCWQRAMFSRFMTACQDDKFYDRVLWYWVLWPWAILSSFMTTCLDVESARHVMWCRVSWLRAKTCCDIVYIENVLEKQNSFSYKMVFDLKTFSSLKMNNIRVIELKVIAKQHGIEGYYKLRKAELIHKLKVLPEVNEQVLIPGLEISQKHNKISKYQRHSWSANSGW